MRRGRPGSLLGPAHDVGGRSIYPWSARGHTKPVGPGRWPETSWWGIARHVAVSCRLMRAFGTAHIELAAPRRLSFGTKTTANDPERSKLGVPSWGELIMMDEQLPARRRLGQQHAHARPTEGSTVLVIGLCRASRSDRALRISKVSVPATAMADRLMTSWIADPIASLGTQ
jgi:hypothetical protein